MRCFAALCLGLLACAGDTFTGTPDAAPVTDSAPPIDAGGDSPRPEGGVVEAGGGDATGGTYCQSNTTTGVLLFCEDFDNGTTMPPVGWAEIVDLGMSHVITNSVRVSPPNAYKASHPATLQFPNQALLRRSSQVGNNAPLKIEFDFRLLAITTGRTEFLKITPQNSTYVTVELLAGLITLAWGAGGVAIIAAAPQAMTYYHGTLIVDYPKGNASLAVSTLGPSSTKISHSGPAFGSGLGSGGTGGGCGLGGGAISLSGGGKAARFASISCRTTTFSSVTPAGTASSSTRPSAFGIGSMMAMCLALNVRSAAGSSGVSRNLPKIDTGPVARVTFTLLA